MRLNDIIRERYLGRKEKLKTKLWNIQRLGRWGNISKGQTREEEWKYKNFVCKWVSQVGWEALLFFQGSFPLQVLSFFLSSRVTPGRTDQFLRMWNHGMHFDFRCEAVSYGELPTHEKHAPTSEIFNRKKLYECKESVKNYRQWLPIYCTLEIFNCWRNLNVKKMGRPVFLPLTLLSMSKCTVLRNLINVKNSEEESVCEEADGE